MTDVVVIQGDDPVTLQVVEQDVQVVEIISEGPQGAHGDRGFSWFHGNGAPGIIANTVAGDFYVDDLTGTTYTCTDAGAGTWVQTSSILGTLRSEAAASAAAALASEQAADASEAAAAASAAAALASQNAASSSAGAALASQNAAAVSAAAALVSEGNADTSEANALASATAAGASETAAGLSQTAAAASAAAALASENAAASSASTATTKAGEASASAAAALASETTATTQAGVATTQAGIATTQASTATTQAGIATTEAGTATTKAGEANASAIAAAASAATATTKAGEADASATAALASKNAAEAAETAAELALTTFKGQYLGAAAVAPTLDGNGNALTAGDLYFDTVANEMRVWSGAAWIAAYLPEAGFATDAELAAAIAAHEALANPHPTYLTQAEGDAAYSALGHAHSFASLTGTPTTIAGYGITDFNTLGDARWSQLGHTHSYLPLAGGELTGNLGIGAAPHASWHSSYDVLQVGAIGAFYGATDTGIAMSNNVYWDGTNLRYISTALASDYYQYAGEHVWRRAVSGTAGNIVTLIQALKITANGNVEVSAPSSGNAFAVTGADAASAASVVRQGNHASAFAVIWYRTGDSQYMDVRITDTLAQLRSNLPIQLRADSDGTIFEVGNAKAQLDGLELGWKTVPQNSKSAAYTTVLADSGKHILHPASDNNARTFTIDSNANVAYPIGTAITFVNLINTVTIAITSDTMYLAGTGTTGSRTLAAYGVATALKVGTTTWIISGTGLT